VITIDKKNYSYIVIVLLVCAAAYVLFGRDNGSGTESINHQFRTIIEKQSEHAGKLDSLAGQLEQSRLELSNTRQELREVSYELITIREGIESAQTGLRTDKELIEGTLGILKGAREREEAKRR
jgi:rubrerythrin